MDSTPTANGSSVYPSTPQPSTDLPPPTDLDPFSLQWLRKAIASQQYSPTLMRTALLYDAKTPKQQREVIAKTLANCVELMEELQGPESVGEGQMSHGEREFPASGTAEEGKEHGEPTADFATAQVDRKVMLERCEETFRLAGTVQRVLIAGARYACPLSIGAKNENRRRFRKCLELTEVLFQTQRCRR